MECGALSINRGGIYAMFSFFFYFSLAYGVMNTAWACFHSESRETNMFGSERSEMGKGKGNKEREEDGEESVLFFVSIWANLAPVYG